MGFRICCLPFYLLIMVIYSNASIAYSISASDHWNKPSNFEILHKAFRAKLKQGIPDWMAQAINTELKYWRTVAADQEKIKNLPLHMLVKVKIAQGKIAVSYQEMRFKVRVQTLIATLTLLGRLVQLPDIELLVSCHDGALVADAPIFCLSKRKKNNKAILLPETQSLHDCESLLRQVQIGKAKYPWHKKLAKAFWRGSSTGGLLTAQNYMDMPRCKLVDISQKNSVVDAKFNVLVQCNSEVALILHKYLGSMVSVTDHLKYKYQIIVDGNTATWGRSWWQAFSECLILKQESDFVLWYYSALLPYKHYVPVASNMSDLVKKIEWAKTHESEVIGIIQNMRNFARANLTYVDMLLYIYVLLVEYAKISPIR